MTRLKSFGRSGAANVAFQFLFLLACFLVGREAWISPGAFWRPAVLLAFVLVPCSLWTVFFYLQDRREPEPHGHVVTAFLAGVGVAAGLALPLQVGLLQLEQWIYQTPTLLVIGSLFAIGPIAAFSVYLVLRYGFYPLREFDEPEDGMIYGSFVGSGFALAVTMFYLSGRPDFTIFVIAYTAATNVLVYASVGALVGYFIGRAKFEYRWGIQSASTMAVAVGAGLLGLYHVADTFIFLEGFHNAFWISFLFTTAFAAVVLWLTYGKLRRLEESDDGERAAVSRRFEPAVVGLFALLLVIAAAGKAEAAMGISFEAPERGLTFRYSHELTASLPSPTILGSLTPANRFSLPFSPEQEVLFTAGRLGSDPAAIAVAAGGPLDDVDAETAALLADVDLLSLTSQQRSLAGASATRVSYSYIVQNPTLDRGFPEVIWAYLDMVESGPSTIFFSYQAPASSFEESEHLYRQILETTNLNE